LCHELAHLRYFDHGPHFKSFYLRILEWSREQKIYRPRDARTERATPASSPATAAPAGPTQLELFRA
jgi:hypothetical protein